ncbi:MAG: DEAD/DEAH box helicase [Myxococcota bacterium]
MDPIQSLFEAIQEASERPIWSKGVQLTRNDAVSIEEREEDAITLRVETRGGLGLSAPQVTLYPDEDDWECSCTSNDDPCEHVIASIIALRQSRKKGTSVPKQGEGRGRIVYELSEKGPDLVMQRSIEFEGKRIPMTKSLTAIAANRGAWPPFVTTPADVAIERAIATRPSELTTGPRISSLLDRLGQSRAVFLNGEPIQVDSEPLGLVARVVDAPAGVRLFVEQDPRIVKAYKSGVIRSAEALHALAKNKLTGRELADLPRGRFYSDDDLATLVTDVIPNLEERIPVYVDTKKLPSTRIGERPRARIDVKRENDGLIVLPTLVYGDPPVARIDAGKLVHIGDGEVPIRNEGAENEVVARLRGELGLRPGVRARLSASEAIPFAARLAKTTLEIVGTAHEDFQLRGALEAAMRIDDDRFELDFFLADDMPLDGEAAEEAANRAAARAQAAEARGDAEAAGGGFAGDVGRTGLADADAPGGNPGSGIGGVRPEAVLRAWSQGESVVALDGGGFASLPKDWLALYGDRIADLLGARDARGRIARHALPDLAMLCEDLEQPPPPSLEGLRPLLDGFEGIPNAPIPPALEDVLRPYQRAGVDWLVFLRRAGLGALLADDMGLGKTIQALCAIDGRTLVVAPTSVLHGWMREIERFRPELSFSIYHGPGRALDPNVDVTITSYALLRQDAAKIGDVEWDCVVLDEAQTIKNPESQIARAAHGLVAKARFALTGTPVENRLDELWSQFHFLNPGLLSGRTEFRNRYSRPIGEGDADVAYRLRQRIKPFLLRRLKSEVAPELPPLSEIVLDCELSAEERAVYDSVRAATVREVVERLKSGGNVMAALEALLRLRQAACHPSLVPGQEDVGASSAKLETLYARLEEAVADGHKALVFSQWTSLLDRVEPGLNDRSIDFARLDGATRDRGAVVERFQSDDGPPVMLLSLRAGGTGLNLTAADHVFLLDPWWNPAVEAQAADRAHRIGQDRPVVLHRLIATDTVEEGILTLHDRKRALADAALEEADGSSRLTRDELVELLESA